jgi:serine protease Do
MAKTKRLLRSSPRLAFGAILTALVLGVLIGSIVSPGTDASPADKHRPKLIRSGGGEPLEKTGGGLISEGFAQVVKTLAPAVVNINTQELVRVANQSPEAFRGLFGPDLFNRFFDQQDPNKKQPRERKVSSLGSGVIVDSDGYILTNYHVVARADKISVELANGKKYLANIIGQDPQSDLAVLKVAAGEPLPFARIGDSKDLEVGDWVLAFGSPFSLEKTVTSGIVSATGRNVAGTRSFGDYIQTDAAINPGNSGGPLVNMQGEVIGINSFIQTRSGGSNGVGFAIPSTVFVNSYNQLVTTGKIERGFIGISMNLGEFTPEMAEFFGVSGQDPDGIKDNDGVLITQLIDEKGKPSDTGPAYRAGIREEDVIVSFNGQEMETSWDLRTAVAGTAPNKVVSLMIVRKGEVKRIKVTLAERTLEQQEQEADEGISLDETPERDRKKEIGIEVRPVSPRDHQRLGFDDEAGMLVLDVTPTSLADDAHLRSGDVITHVNGNEVSTASAFREAILSLPSGSGVVLRVVTFVGQKQVRFTSFRKP